MRKDRPRTAGRAQPDAHSHEPDGSHVPLLVKTLQDAVAATSGAPGDHVENAVVANVRIVSADLPRASPPLAEALKAGKLEIVGVRYDPDTGIVTRIITEDRTSAEAPR